MRTRRALAVWILVLVVIAVVSALVAEWVVTVILPSPFDEGGEVQLQGEFQPLPVAHTHTCVCSPQTPPPLGAPLPPWGP